MKRLEWMTISYVCLSGHRFAGRVEKDTMIVALCAIWKKWNKGFDQARYIFNK